MANQILMKETEGPPPAVAPSAERGWRILGWFGLLLLLIGLGDVASNLYKPSFGSAEWEFATIGRALGALPLLTMGLGVVAASLAARGVRWGVILTGVGSLVLGLLVVGAYLIFLTDVPLALRSTASTAAAIPIRRAVIRTSILGLGFSVGYVAGAWVLLRSLKGRGRP